MLDETFADREARAAGRICPRCGGIVDVRSRHVLVSGKVIRVFCSAECLRDASSGEEPSSSLSAPISERDETTQPLVLRPWHSRPLLVLLVAGVAGAALVREARTETVPPSPGMAIAEAAVASSPVPQAGASAPVPLYGPQWPPSEKDWIAEIGQDTWIHPLNGPVRRMPIRDSRVFGAERPGDRPAACRSGHCGVDIGGEIWGEHVLAVHDGVIDRVQRGPNEDHGGLYVRVAHRNGTVFTQYFHLAAIPRRLAAGMLVKAGEVIGLVGDTGVKESGAHLHFTISVRPSKELVEQYIDPEPLIALWPLRIPVEGTVAGLVSTSAEPGIPRGAAGRTRKLAVKHIRKPVERPERADRLEAPSGGASPAAPADAADPSQE